MSQFKVHSHKQSQNPGKLACWKQWQTLLVQHSSGLLQAALLL